MSNIYFDNAATTQIDQSVIDIMSSVMTNNYGNPNSTHSFGRSSGLNPKAFITRSASSV